jgi:DNA-binding beta-propeller fold protein YncE
MSDYLDDLARTAAETLVSAMTTDSWEAAKSRFIQLVGRQNERRMDAARAEIASRNGADRADMQRAQTRAWGTRLRDLLDDNPSAAQGLRALLADMAAPYSWAAPTSQRVHAGGGSRVINAGRDISNGGDVIAGDKITRKTNLGLAPFAFVVRSAKAAAQHPAVTAATAAVVLGAATFTGWHAHWPGSVFGVGGTSRRAQAVQPSGSLEVTSRPGETPVPHTTTVLILGQSTVALMNSSTHKIVKTLNYDEQSPALEGGVSGSTLVAFAQTSRGLTAYILEYGQVVPVYLATDTIGQAIDLGAPTWAIAASPDGKTVYVASGVPGQDGQVTPIDTAVNGAGTPIPVGESPAALTFGPGGRTLYVLNTNDNTVTPIDVAAGTAGQPIPFQSAAPDKQLLVTPDGKTAYISTSDGLLPIDTTAGIAGTPVDLRAAPVPETGTSSGNTVSATQLSASYMVLSPNGRILYDGIGGGTGWRAVDTTTNTVSAYLAPESQISQLILSPDGRTLYGIDYSGTIWAVDTATKTVSMRTQVGTGDQGEDSDMVITPDGSSIFILQGNNLFPFSTVTRSMGTPVKLPPDASYDALVVAP